MERGEKMSEDDQVPDRDEVNLGADESTLTVHAARFLPWVVLTEASQQKAAKGPWSARRADGDPSTRNRRKWTFENVQPQAAGDCGWPEGEPGLHCPPGSDGHVCHIPAGTRQRH